MVTACETFLGHQQVLCQPLHHLLLLRRFHHHLLHLLQHHHYLSCRRHHPLPHWLSDHQRKHRTLLWGHCPPPPPPSPPLSFFAPRSLWRSQMAPISTVSV